MVGDLWRCGNNGGIPVKPGAPPKRPFLTVLSIEVFPLLCGYYETAGVDLGGVNLNSRPFNGTMGVTLGCFWSTVLYLYILVFMALQVYFPPKNILPCKNQGD